MMVQGEDLVIQPIGFIRHPKDGENGVQLQNMVNHETTLSNEKFNMSDSRDSWSVLSKC